MSSVLALNAKPPQSDRAAFQLAVKEAADFRRQNAVLSRVDLHCGGKHFVGSSCLSRRMHERPQILWKARPAKAGAGI